MPSTATFTNHSGQLISVYAGQDKFKGSVLAIGQPTTAAFSVALATSKWGQAAIVSVSSCHIGSKPQQCKLDPFKISALTAILCEMMIDDLRSYLFRKLCMCVYAF